MPAQFKMTTRLCFFSFTFALAAAIPLTAPAAFLSTTFTNPAPASHLGFGYSMTAVGENKVLIGATDNANRAGVAYLFHSDGTLVTNFTSPNSANGDYFGGAAAALGSDALIIGSPFQAGSAPRTGAAYLFDINGALVTTFTNPAPTGFNNFGVAVTAVATDKVLIGANGDNTGGTGAGAAYLFSTNGVLLTAFTNPAPNSYESFGRVVAAYDTERIIIGADFDYGDDGAVYLYKINGHLLTTFTNPSPASIYFGSAVAAAGDKVLIGAGGGDGAAYLFSQRIPPDHLHKSHSRQLHLVWVCRGSRHNRQGAHHGFRRSCWRRSIWHRLHLQHQWLTLGHADKSQSCARRPLWLRCGGSRSGQAFGGRAKRRHRRTRRGHSLWDPPEWG
jgi:hypothetical protein